MIKLSTVGPYDDLNHLHHQIRAILNFSWPNAFKRMITDMDSLIEQLMSLDLDQRKQIFINHWIGCKTYERYFQIIDEEVGLKHPMVSGISVSMKEIHPKIIFCFSLKMLDQIGHKTFFIEVDLRQEGIKNRINLYDNIDGRKIPINFSHKHRFEELEFVLDPEEKKFMDLKKKITELKEMTKN